MAERGVVFYRNWIAWASKRALHLPGEGDRQLFVADLLAVFEALGALEEGWPKGSGIGLVMNASKWAKKHPDPLLPVRQAMAAMRERWGQV